MFADPIALSPLGAIKIREHLVPFGSANIALDICSVKGSSARSLEKQPENSNLIINWQKRKYIKSFFTNGRIEENIHVFLET